MRRTMMFLAAVLAAGATSASAANTDREFYPGEALYQRCSANPADADFGARKAQCKGYIVGVSDTLQANQAAAPISGPTRAAAICLPDVDSDQLVEGVVRYLSDHPDSRHFAAPDLIYIALKAAYPCAKP
jgi:hypothetical protein